MVLKHLSDSQTFSTSIESVVGFTRMQLSTELKPLAHTLKNLAHTSTPFHLPPQMIPALSVTAHHKAFAETSYQVMAKCSPGSAFFHG